MTTDRRAAAAAVPLADRIDKYERIIEMRGPADAPKMTLEDIGATFDPPLTREAVRQIIERGRPRAVGRPPRER